MLEKEYVLNIVKRLKAGLKLELKNKNYELALELVYNTANVLYQTNLYYEDDDLERSLQEIAKGLDLKTFAEPNKDALIFYDGFGLNNRGLARIYLKALCKIRKVYYISYKDRKDQIPALLNILNANSGEAFFLDNNCKFTKKIKDLNEIINQIHPQSFVFYSYPSDVVGTTIMSAYAAKMKRYLINLTDHTFWLGAKCLDTCIEFRDYGASISNGFRGISRDKLVKLPYYPEVDRDAKFQGFPFEKRDNQKVIFSGGQLYKTLGGGHKYYQMVDHILERNEDAIFWYAGNGDDRELKKILNKYPLRAFHTEERTDLFQILQRCRLYLSTYPICGGLMYQFAALAGKVPVTLRYDECNEGLLLNQSELNVDFDELEPLYREVERILTDDKYYQIREKQMLRAVVSETEFENKLFSILRGNYADDIVYSELDTRNFREEYLTRIDNGDIDRLLTDKKSLNAGIKYMPSEFIRGGGKSYKENLCDVSVIVCDYNPKVKSLQYTLDSILNQKGVDFEVVIVDDGSKNNLHEIIEDYFYRNRFYNWTIVCNKENRGIVRNVYSGLDISKGRYCKLISPGDSLNGEYILKDWMNFCKEQNCRWSFSEAVYYQGDPDQKNYISVSAHPQDLTPYIKHDSRLCRWNYTALDDIALGASIFSETSLLKEYIDKIIDKVIYAEDNVWRMMMFDGIIGMYFPENAVFYEFGTGISTKKSDVWSQRIQKDWDTANLLMVENKELDQFQEEVIIAWKYKKSKSKWHRLKIKGWLKSYLRRRLKTRKTEILCK